MTGRQCDGMHWDLDDPAPRRGSNLFPTHSNKIQIVRLWQLLSLCRVHLAFGWMFPQTGKG